MFEAATGSLDVGETVKGLHKIPKREFKGLKYLQNKKNPSNLLQNTDKTISEFLQVPSQLGGHQHISMLLMPKPTMHWCFLLKLTITEEWQMLCLEEYKCMEISGLFEIFMCYPETMLFSVKYSSPSARVSEKRASFWSESRLHCTTPGNQNCILNEKDSLLGTLTAQSQPSCAGLWGSFLPSHEDKQKSYHPTSRWGCC